jgi:hypothetical protein
MATRKPKRAGRDKVLSRTIDGTEIHTWFERDRQHVELRDKLTDKTIIEWWDDAVTEAVQDGFLKPRDYHRSAYDYAIDVGALKPAPTAYYEDTSIDTTGPAKHPKSITLVDAKGQPIIKATGHDLEKLLRDERTPEDWKYRLFEFAENNGVISSR